MSVSNDYNLKSAELIFVNNTIGVYPSLSGLNPPGNLVLEIARTYKSILSNSLGFHLNICCLAYDSLLFIIKPSVLYDYSSSFSNKVFNCFFPISSLIISYYLILTEYWFPKSSPFFEFSVNTNCYKRSILFENIRSTTGTPSYNKIS